MAGKSHELTAKVILQGQVDNTFTQIGTQLQNLGEQLLRTNRWVINFGKESLDAYVDFDDAMRVAHEAMKSVYSDNMSSMESDYQKMRKSAMDYAATTKFSTLEIASAYAQATHAGKNFTDSEKLMGAAINLAYAGNMDLADAMDALIVIMNSAGMSMDEVDTVVDELVYGGNLAATTVDEITEAMVRFGPGLRFFNGNTAAAVAMFGTLADNGMKGSEAGTALRTAMLRLIAPTQKGADAMTSAALAAELGYDSIEEYEEAMEEAGGMSEEAAALLEEMGFSIYDENGNMKDALTIWAEYIDLVEKVRKEKGNEAADALLSSVFSARQIYTAKAFVNDMDQTMDKYNTIMNNSAGFAEEAAETMEGGFGGLKRGAEATLNAFQTRMGGILADDLTPFVEGIGDVLDWLYNLDEGKLSAAAAFFETIIGGAGALVAAGAGMKLIGTAVGTMAGGPYVMAAIAAAALVAAAGDYAETVRQNKLGDMELDIGSFTSTFERLAGAFDGKYADLALYNEQMGALIEKYKTASQTFSQGLWDMMINGSGWSEEEWSNKEKDMVAQIEATGDTLRSATGESYGLALNYAGANAAEDDTGIWARVQEYINIGYESTLDDIEDKSQELRKAVLSAFSDGELTSDEIDNIMKLYAEYDQLMAKAAASKNEAELYEMLYNNRTISYDSLKGLYEAATGPRDRLIAADEEMSRLALADALEGIDIKAEREGWTEEEIRAEKMRVTEVNLTQRDADISARNMSVASELLEMFKTAMMGSWMRPEDASDLSWLIDDGVNAFKYVNELVDAIGYDTITEMAKTNKDAQDVLAAYNRWTFEGSKAGESAETTFGFDLFGWTDDAADWAIKAVNTIKDNFDVELPIKADHSQYDQWKYTVEMQGVTIPVYFKNGGGGNPGDPTNLLRDAYAEGGRADVASIFGEAGPEWAIPEEHSSRTAELLRMAAAASGFTWGELLSARGGLNAGSGGASTVVYSPTIYANDAKGLRDELIADKSRLEKWFRERELKEELISYT